MNSILDLIVKIYLIFLAITGCYSLIIIVFGKNIFKKYNKNHIYAYIPIINLMVMLRITRLPLPLFLLLLLPITNVIVIIIINNKLYKLYDKSILYFWGLILFPYVFIPLLNKEKNYTKKSKSKKKKIKKYRIEEKEIEKVNDLNLMSEEELKKLNKIHKKEKKPDSIFKTKFDEIEEAEAYKALRHTQDIDLVPSKELDNEENDEETIEELDL